MKQLLLLLFCIPFALFSQQLKGVVIDDETSLPIPFAQVQTMDNQGSSTNEMGEFTLELKTLPVKLIVSAADYQTDTIEVNTWTVQLRLKTIEAEEIGMVVVAASRRKQAVEEVPISLEIIKPDLITNKGITDLEQAVDQAPGAYAMDGQISIRGGSGFSYGAGSRVLVLWNEVPLLSGDAGDTKWNSIPIEQAQQIEVIKGASSVLYGSGALNGMVSLIEREPSPEAAFSARYQTGIYDNPRRETLKWWDKSPMQHQADVTFSKQFNRIGVNVGAYGFTNDGYRQGETEDRIRFNGTIYWKPAKIEKLKVSLGWNAQMQKTGNFIIWASDTFAYQPAGGADTSVAGSTLTYNRGDRLTIDPSVKYFDKFGNRHQLRSRFYYIDNRNFTNLAQSSNSQVYYGDYQFQRSFGKQPFVVTAGTSAIRSVVNSSLFGDHYSTNFAGYLQLEKKWKKFDITAGVRAEYFEMDGRSVDTTGKKVMPIFRTGVHYELFKFTHLRASYGQGVRYPSVAERYTQTAVGSLLIFPNPNLQPETGQAVEFGIKQGVKIKNWKGFLDASVFLNQYKNMMEFTFGNYKPDSIPYSFNPNDPGYPLKWLGFRAENAEEARITGFELSLAGEGKIGSVTLQTLMGYTYMNPIALNINQEYKETFSDTNSTMLKYRFRHMAKADVQLLWKGISLGGSMRMNSFMENIDATFENGVLGQQILVGLKEYRAENNGINLVFDARIGYEWKEHYKVAFIINNLANAEYTTRPGDVQAPRTFLMQISYKL
jgi:outer membrane receptor protein involved in Fe transport